MKEAILKYLEFLLPIHNCVVIPDFGGFIINVEDSIPSIDGKLNPPTYNIVFNPDLNHNDGILASYIIKDESISYNAACNKIKESVRIIKSDLKAKKTVQCGNIGSLSTDNDGNIIFSSNRANIYPAFYGLYPTNVQRIEDINRALDKEKRHLSLKYITGGVAAAVAAIFMFIAPGADIKDNGKPVTQEAGFISSITKSSAAVSDNIEVNTDEAINAININKDDDTTYDAWGTSTENDKFNKAYYIVVGGEKSTQRADILLEKIKNAGFSQASLIESPERIRIYVRSFDDKMEAETYLERFRIENPQYSTAWLYSK